MPDPDGGATLLVLAPNWLGDAVMASPLLSRLAAGRDRKGCAPRLLLAVRRPWLPLYAADSRLAGTLPVERNGRHAGLAGLWRLGRDLSAAGADAVVLGPPSLRAALAARLANVPVRVGHRGDGRDILLTHAVARRPRGIQHHSEELLALAPDTLAACGLVADEATAPVPDLLPGCAGLPAVDPGQGPAVWALAPGSTYGAAKVWPAANAAAFADLAVDEAGVRVVLLGDAAAAPFVGEMAELSRVAWRREIAGPPGVVDLTGRTDLVQAVGVLKGAAAFVGNDSGLMHVAGALGLATVGVFGSTNPAWTAPLGPRTSVVSASGYPCQPCYLPTCNQPRFCLADVAAKTVLAAVRALAPEGLTAGGGP